MHEDNPLIDRLVSELRPTRPQRVRTGWSLLALAMLATVAGVHLAFGLKPAAAMQGGGLWFVMGETLLATLGLACAIAVIRMSSPQQVGRPAAFWFAIAASAMPFAAVAWLIASAIGMEAPGGVPGHASCAAWGTLSGSLVAVTLSLWLKRGAPASLHRAGLYTGIAAGAIGSAIYGLSCPVPGFGHWSIWHFAPVLVSAVAGRYLLPMFHRW